MNGFYTPVFVYSIIVISLLFWMLVLRLFFTVITVTAVQLDRKGSMKTWDLLYCGESTSLRGIMSVWVGTLFQTTGPVGKMHPRQTL